MKPVAAVLFDLDGTLVDTAPDMVAAANALRALAHLPDLPFEDLRGQVSHGAIGLVKVAMLRQPEDPEFERLRMDFLALYGEREHHQSLMFPGMDVVLAQLENAGIPWGVVTNKPAAFTMPLLERLQLDDRPGVLVMGDTLTHRKPHPEPLLHACRELGASPARTLYVGDAERDFIASRRAGVRGAVALWGYIGTEDDPRQWAAEVWLRSPAHLSACLDGAHGDDDHARSDTGKS